VNAQASSADAPVADKRLPVAHRLWSIGNALLLLVVLWQSGGSVLLVLLLIVSDHDPSELWQDHVPWWWAAGALVGLAVAALASRAGGRLVPWLPVAVLCGALVGGTVPIWSFGGLQGVIGYGPPLALAVSAWGRARSARPYDPALSRRGRVAAGCILTAAVLGAVTVVAVLAVRLSQPTPLYEAMRMDPMSATSLPGLELQTDDSRDADEAFFPTPPQIARVWRITDGSSRDAKLSELRRLAEQSGWASSSVGPPCSYRKLVGDYGLCLSISPGIEGGDSVAIEIIESPG